MANPEVANPRIREEVLRDTRYPVHRIADQLLPYLAVLVEQFHPRKVVLFGSYAYGEPGRDSDVDLLVVKEMSASPIAEATAIRKAMRPLRHHFANLAFDIMVRSPDDMARKLAQGAYFHTDIVNNGIDLVA